MSDVNASIGINFDTSTALAQLKNLQRELSVFHASVAKSSATAAIAQSQLQKELLNSINATGKFAASMVTIKTGTESFTHALETNKLSMGQYFRYAGASTKTFGRLFKSEFDTLGKVAEERVKSLQTQYIKMGRDANGSLKAMAIKPLALDMKDFGTQTQIAAQKQALFGQLLKQGSTNLLNFGKNTQWAGRQLMVGFSIPLMALGTAASKSFMEMEAAALKFKKVYGDLGTSQEEANAQLDNIKALANGFTQYGVAASKTVGLASEAAAAGFQGLDLQRQTTEATRLSVLGQIDSQQALETTISLQNAFNISSADLADSINFLNSVENQTVTSLDDITVAIPKVAPVIQSLGGNVKDLAFFLTAMKEGGVNAAEGANALKSGLAALINPSKSASDMLANYGINVAKIVEGNKGNLKATVVEFAQALDKLAPLDRAKAIEQMFGKFQFARISTLLNNITTEGTQAQKVLGLANASAAELANTANKELGLTAQSAMNKFKKAVEDLKVAIIPVGQAFLEAVTPIVSFAEKILDKFTSLPDGIKKAVTVMGVIVGGLGPVLLMSFGLLANGVANIIKLFASLRNGFLTITGRSKDLGEQTKYLTAEQLEATTVAASLNQAHSTLTQSFTAEASAVNSLKNAYLSATDAARAFTINNPGMMLPKGRKYASGVVSVPGSGTGDTVPAMLTPGEAVIPAPMAKKYAPLIAGMIAGNIPGYANGYQFPVGVDNRTSQYGHITTRIEMTVNQFLDELLRLPENLKAKRQADINRLTSLQSLGGGNESVNAYTSLGVFQSEKLNQEIGEGISKVPIKDFVDDFEHFGIKMWIPALKNGGVQLEEVSGELEQYHQKLKEKVIQEGIDNKTNTLTGKRFQELEAELRKTIPATSKLRMSLDSAQAKIDEYRINLSTAFANKVKAERPDLVVNQGTTRESILVQGAKGTAQIRVKGDRYTKKDILGRQAMLAQQQALTAQQVAAAQPFANSPQFERKVDLTGGGSYRGTISSFVTQQTIVRNQEQAKRLADATIASTAKAAGVQSPSKRTIPIGEDIARGLQVGMDKQSANVAKSAKNMADAATRGAESSTELYGKTGYISPIEKSIRRQNELRMRDLPSRSVVNKDAFTIAVQEEKQRRVNIAGLDKMNKAIMGGTFALTSIAAAGQMAGGSLGQISNQVMKYSGALYALMTVTQLVTQTKIAELAIGRLAAAKQAAAFASYGKGMLGTSGLLGSISRFGFAITKFLGPVGLVTTGLFAAYSVIKASNAARERERQRLEAFGDTLTNVGKAAKTLGDYFGYTPTKSLYTSSASLKPKSVQQTSDIENFMGSDQFKSKDIQDIVNSVKKNQSNKSIKSSLTIAGYKMLSEGASQENVQTFIDSILSAAGKTDITLDFKSLKISKENIDSVMNEYKAGLDKLGTAYKSGKKTKMRFENPDGTYRTETIQDNRKQVAAETKNQAKSISTFNESLSLAFQNGKITSEQFLKSFEDLNKEIIKNTPNSEARIKLLVEALALTDPALAKLVANIKDYNTVALIMQARSLGIAISQENLSLMSVKASGDLIISAAQVAAAAEIQAEVMKRLADITKDIDKKTGGLTGKDKLNALQQRTKELRDQNKVMIALRKSGIDYATAQDLASDASVRAILLSAQSAGLNSKKWKDAIAQVKEYAKVNKALQKSLIAGQDQGDYEKSRLEMAQNYVALQEHLIDMQNRPQLTKYQTEIESINTQLDDIKIKEDEINSAYEIQSKTLSKIKSINEAMAASDQKRLSIANALTSGDISAAAQAVQEARAQASSNAMDIAEQALTAGKDRSIAALGGTLLEKQLTALQKQQKALEDNIKKEKERIKWLGMTKDQIDDAVRALDLAKNANIDINDPNFLNNILKGAKGDSEALGLALKDVAKQAQNALNSLASLRTTSYNMNTMTGNVFDGTPFGQSGNNKVASNSLDFYPKPYVGTGFGQAGSAAAIKAAKQSALLGTPFGQMSMGGWVPRYFANGGLSKGTDIIPAMLTPGEFVVNKNAAGKFGPLLQQLNSSRYPDSLSFGGTPSVTAVSSNNVNNSSTVYNYSLNVTANSNNASPDDIARTVIAQIRGLEAQRIRGNR